jgi:hypothetical protein
MNSTTIESRLRDFLTGKAEEEGIAAAWLFGPETGVGLLYSLDSSELFGVAGEINEIFGIRAVPLNEAGPELAIRIFSEGTLLVERDRKRRVEFEVGTRNEYWDFEPYLHRIRKASGLPLRPSLEDLLDRYREARQ